MGARPNWEYIRVDVLLPNHPKLDGLNYPAKWTLLELWCHCGQYLTDGFVRDAVWRKFGTANARRLLVEHGLAIRVEGGYQMHDYLLHQRSRAQVEELRDKRAKAGSKGGKAKANAVALAKQKPQQVLKQNASKSLAEAEAEAEADLNGAVGSQSAGSNGHAADDDQTGLIIKELLEATGRHITPEWAAKVRAHILNGRQPANPSAYIRQAIRSEPNPRLRFLEQG